MLQLWHGLIQLLSVIMVFYSKLTGSYGLGIILLTVTLRLLLFPLYRAQLQSMKRMQQMQPELKRLQDRFKDDKQRLAEEQLRLYKDAKVNPLASCWPMLLQMPLLYAMYGLLEKYSFAAIPGVQVHFLWLSSLKAKDPYLILPILGGLSTYWQTRISMALQPGSGQQQMQMMSYMMPLVMFFVFRGLAAGLALYWVISNIFTVVQQYLTVGSLNPPTAAAEGSAPQGPQGGPKNPAKR